MSKSTQIFLVVIYTLAIFLWFLFPAEGIVNAAYAQTNISELCLSVDEIRGYLRDDITHELDNLIKNNDIAFYKDKPLLESTLNHLKDKIDSNDSLNKNFVVLENHLKRLKQNPGNSVTTTNTTQLTQLIDVLMNKVDRWRSQEDREKSLPCLSSDIPHAEELRASSSFFSNKDFDYLSWQTFIALNWSADENGKSNEGISIGNNLEAPRVWEFYKDPANVFVEPDVEVSSKFIDLPTIPDACKTSLKELGKLDEIERGVKLRQIKVFSTSIQDDGVAKAAEFLQAQPSAPLIDQNKNYVLYETRLNEDEFKYILNNKLYDADEQSKIPINFPASNKNAVGAIEIKASWRILPNDTSDEIKKRYYTKKALIYIPKYNAEEKKNICGLETVGLVGFHIMHKTEKQPQRVWATFEQVDNAPDQEQVKQGNLQGPFSFWSLECSVEGQCIENKPLSKNSSDFLWLSNQPYANKYIPTQVVREDSILPNSSRIVNNDEWHQLLNKALKNQNCTNGSCNSVWQYYQLIGTQWSSGSNLTPENLANTTMETYIQKSSCFNCHSGAQTAGNFPKSADLSFLLRLAKSGGGH